MKTIKAFIKSHRVLSYFALTFTISWGGMLLVMVAVPGGFPGTREQVETRLNFAMLAWTAGPPLAGILLTGLLYGREGFRNLLTRMTRWRVGARWYAVALLTAPLLFMVVPLALSLSSPEFVPGIFTTSDLVFLLLFGIGWGLLGGGFLEELGWTGFAVPTLLRLRYGVLSTGLIVGVLWGALHFPVFVFASDTYSGALPLAIYLPAYLIILLVGGLPAYRVLMVWVYDRSGGSLLVAMLMHASYTAFTFILGPLALAGVALLIYDLVLAGALWVVVAAVAVVNGGHLSRQPLPRRRVA
jgi:membrane protease YdiL (CAAX protease family)